MWMESILHFPYISYKFCLFTAMTMSQVSVSCQCFPGPRSPSSKQVGPWPFGAQTWHSREDPWTKRRFTAVIVLRIVAGGFSRTPCLITGWCFGRIPNYHGCVCVCVCVCGVFFRSPTSQEKQELVAETWCKEGPSVFNRMPFQCSPVWEGRYFRLYFEGQVTSIKTLQEQLPSRPCWVQFWQKMRRWEAQLAEKMTPQNGPKNWLDHLDPISNPGVLGPKGFKLGWRVYMRKKQQVVTVFHAEKAWAHMCREGQRQTGGFTCFLLLWTTGAYDEKQNPPTWGWVQWLIQNPTEHPWHSWCDSVRLAKN